MQIFILLCGVLLFAVFQFQKTPIHFNDKVTQELSTNHKEQYAKWLIYNDSIHQISGQSNLNPSDQNIKQQLHQLNQNRKVLQQEVRNYVKINLPKQESNDRDYVFLYYILHYLPQGFIGLMIAVILCAAMSSISAEINALSGTTVVDIALRLFPFPDLRNRPIFWSKCFALFWGLVAIAFALYANLFENLIQFINIIGSLFYGTILGIFLTGFYLKKIQGGAVFYAALIAQCLTLFLFKYTDLGFLWFNAIACLTVMSLAIIFQMLLPIGAKKNKPETIS